MDELKKRIINAIDNNRQRTLEIADFLAVDMEKACIQGAKLPAMNAITPLSNNGVVARKISAQPKLMDKQTYLNYKNRMTTREEYNYDQA